MMKYLLAGSVALLCSAGVSAQVKKTTVKTVSTTAVPVLKNAIDSFSYAAGISVAQNMKDQGITEMNAEMMRRAIDDVYKNRKPLLDQSVATATLQNQMQKFMEKKSAAETAKAGAEKQVSAAFMAENAKRKEVTTLPNGLQYEVLKAGDSNGKKPLAVDTVVVHYVGTLIDGTKFDSSVDRGEPASFPLNGVIRGWTEILQLMTVGSKWKVVIPSDLGYGDRGAGGAIKPGATLIFEIELLDIKPASK